MAKATSSKQYVEDIDSWITETRRVYAGLSGGDKTTLAGRITAGVECGFNCPLYSSGVIESYKDNWAGLSALVVAAVLPAEYYGVVDDWIVEARRLYAALDGASQTVMTDRITAGQEVAAFDVPKYPAEVIEVFQSDWSVLATAVSA